MKYFTKYLKNASLISILAILCSSLLLGCEEGPAEEAGEAIDETVTDARNKAEDVCEDVKEGVDAEDKDC